MEIRKIFKKIDAYYVKNLRKMFSDTADTLSESIGVNKTTIYYIENGIKSISDEMLNKILKYYEVKYDGNPQIYYEAYNLTIDIFESYLFKDFNKLEQLTNAFFEKEEIYQCSRACVFVNLINVIINLLKDRSMASILLDDIKDEVSIFDNNIAGIYVGIYATGKDAYLNLHKVKEAVIDVYENISELNLKPSIKGMMFYQVGKIKSFENDYLEALKLFELDIKNLQEVYCIERITQIKIDIAGVFLDLGLFDKAESLYLKCLGEAQKYNFEWRKRACLNNLTYLYFIERKFEECLIYAKKAKEVGSTQPDISYYQAYCIYQTRSKSEASAVITKMLNSENDRYTYRMLKMIKGFVNDNCKMIDLYFGRVKNQLLKHQNITDLKILYKLNIFYYRENNSERYHELLDEFFDYVN